MSQRGDTAARALGGTGDEIAVVPQEVAPRQSRVRGARARPPAGARGRWGPSRRLGVMAGQRPTVNRWSGRACRLRPPAVAHDPRRHARDVDPTSCSTSSTRNRQPGQPGCGTAGSTGVVSTPNTQPSASEAKQLRPRAAWKPVTARHAQRHRTIVGPEPAAEQQAGADEIDRSRRSRPRCSQPSPSRSRYGCRSAPGACGVPAARQGANGSWSGAGLNRPYRQPSTSAPAPAVRTGRATRSRPTGRSPGRAASCGGRSASGTWTRFTRSRYQT